MNTIFTSRRVVFSTVLAGVLVGAAGRRARRCFRRRRKAAGRERAPRRPPAVAAPTNDIRVLKVRENIFMLTGAGGNITVMTFPEGALVVDTGTTQMANAVLETVRRLSPKQITHIIDTNAIGRSRRG